MAEQTLGDRAERLAANFDGTEFTECFPTSEGVSFRSKLGTAASRDVTIGVSDTSPGKIAPLADYGDGTVAKENRNAIKKYTYTNTKGWHIQTRPRAIEVGGVIRNTSEGWSFISNRPLLGPQLSVQTGVIQNRITIAWDTTGLTTPQVVYFVVTPDEEYARHGIFCGASSVGANVAHIELATQGVWDLLTYNSDTDNWDATRGEFSGDWVGNNLKVTYTAGYPLSLTSAGKEKTKAMIIGENRSGSTAILQAEGSVAAAASREFSFWSYSGTKINDPIAGLRLYVSNPSVSVLLDPDADVAADTLGNLWFHGLIIDEDDII